MRHSQRQRTIWKITKTTQTVRFMLHYNSKFLKNSKSLAVHLIVHISLSMRVYNLGIVPRERQLVSSLEIDSISQICASSLPALEAGKDMAFQNPLRFDKNMSDVECSSSAPDSTGTHLDGKDKDESGVDVSEFLTFKSIADDETHSANNNNLFPYQGFDPFRVVFKVQILHIGFIF